MQCTSYGPVYYHARDLNGGASGISWHLFNNNANYGEERGYNISLPQGTMDQYLSYDKEEVRQIIQNQEATFRYQVQELHRLYRRQRDLMDEVRMRQIFAHHLLSQTSESIHCLSHTPSEISQTSHATSWLLGDCSPSKLSRQTAEKIQEQTTLSHGPLVRKNSYNEVKFLSLSSRKGNEKRNFDLELPSDVYHDDEEDQFKVGNLSEAPELTCNTPEKLPNVCDSEIDSVKTRDLSSFNLNTTERNCLIDLNEEPIQLESSLPSSSSAPCVSVDAISESVFSEQSRLLNHDGSRPDGITSSVAIDLNAVPVGCFSETEITLENNIVEDTKIDVKFLEPDICIDLNTGVVLDEPSPPISSTIQIKSSGDTILEGPVSPENEECTPPRGKSEDIQVEASALLSVQQEPNTIAAQTLLMISSSDVTEPLTNFTNCLCWFAEIVSSITGDDQENEVIESNNDAADNDDQSKLRIYDCVATTLKGSKKRAQNLSHFVKKENSRTRRTRRCKDTQTENEGRKACAKSRKCSKSSSPSDVVMKSMSSILKQPTTRSKQGGLQGWGKMRKREGGHRRRASKFLVIS